MAKVSLDIDVCQAAKNRISWVFDRFSKVYVSFSGGKDSTVLLHLTMDEAIRRSRKVGLLFIDLEAQYKLTIDHVQECFDLYHDHVDPYWVALPIHLRNAVSQYQPHWICWDKAARDDWVRMPPDIAITELGYFPFFRYGMEFEEFVEDFGHWYGGDELTCCLVGIRSDESLNRFRTLMMDKQCFEDVRWTTYKGQTVFNAYPIYDWRTADVWTYMGRTGKPYNRLYNLMHRAGLTIHQMRICQPYGDDQRKGLWLFHIIEPQTWARVVARVNGANQGALYAREMGNILGNIKIRKPPGHTWQSFAMLLLGSMPNRTQEHYKNKIAVFLHWYAERGYPNGIPDDGPLDRTKPSWKRICKTLLRNDYWCKGLSFSQHKSKAYERYIKIMRKRRARWKLI